MSITLFFIPALALSQDYPARNPVSASPALYDDSMAEEGPPGENDRPDSGRDLPKSSHLRDHELQGAESTHEKYLSENKSKVFSQIITPVEVSRRGNWLFTGASRFGISMGPQKVKSSGSSSSNSNSTFYNVDFIPKAGYFLLNNFAAGIFLDFTFYNNVAKSSSGYGYKGITAIAGPFLRYYVPVNEKFLPFAETQFGWGIDRYTRDETESEPAVKVNENVFTFRAGAGATYMVNPTIGFDMFMGYLHDVYKSQENDNRTSISDEFHLQLGIVIIISPSE